MSTHNIQMYVFYVEIRKYLSEYLSHLELCKQWHFLEIPIQNPHRNECDIFFTTVDSRYLDLAYLK